MKRKITPLFLFALFCFLMSINNARGQSFWSEDFSDNIFLNGWTTQDTNPIGESNVIWERCSEVENCPPKIYPIAGDLGFGILQSPTADNGYVFADSQGAGDITGTHISELTSPAINCLQQSQVFLQFYTHIGTATLNAAVNAKLRVKLDETWNTFYVFPELQVNNDLQYSNNSVLINFDLTEIAAGQEEIQLQWQWTGNTELAWVIDDVQLFDYDPSLPECTVWSERFDGGIGNWESVNESDPDANWVWVLGGHVNDALSAIKGTFIASRTPTDGAMIFNADYLTLMGDPINATPPFPEYVCELISPVIDLSNIDQPLELHLSQMALGFLPAGGAPISENGQPAITSFSISTDNGGTWSTAIDINPGLPTTTTPEPPFQSREVFPLPPIQGSAEVKIKFTWAGNLFYWALDDIVIAKRPAFDMKVNRNFFSVLPNAMTPLSQVDSAVFLADLTNIGGQEATGVSLHLNITEDTNGQELFNDSLFHGSVEADQLVENLLLERYFLPTDVNNTGKYSALYNVSHDSLDARPMNDTIHWHFEITDTTFAKELGPTRNIASSESYSYSYGNCFYVPNGDGYVARSLTFGVSNAIDLAGKEVITLLLQWGGDTNGDNLVNESFEVVGSNSYTFIGNESDRLLTIPVDLEAEHILLQDDTYYIIAVSYEADDETPCFFLASQAIDYSATWYVTDSIGRNRYASVLDVGNTGIFDVVGFGLDVVPVIRLHIGKLINTRTIEAGKEISVYPNPADQELTIALEEGFQESIQLVRVRNTAGSLIHTQDINNQYSIRSLDTRSWAPGIYFLELEGEKITYSKKIVIQR